MIKCLYEMGVLIKRLTLQAGLRSLCKQTCAGKVQNS